MRAVLLDSSVGTFGNESLSDRDEVAVDGVLRGSPSESRHVFVPSGSILGARFPPFRRPRQISTESRLLALESLLVGDRVPVLVSGDTVRRDDGCEATLVFDLGGVRMCCCLLDNHGRGAVLSSFEADGSDCRFLSAGGTYFAGVVIMDVALEKSVLEALEKWSSTKTMLVPEFILVAIQEVRMG